MYVHNTIQRDLKKRYGPHHQKGWTKYAWRLVHHLLGSDDDILKTKKKNVGVDALLTHNTLQAVVGEHLQSLRLLSIELINYIYINDGICLERGRLGLLCISTAIRIAKRN